MDFRSFYRRTFIHDRHPSSASVCRPPRQWAVFAPISAQTTHSTSVWPKPQDWLRCRSLGRTVLSPKLGLFHWRTFRDRQRLTIEAKMIVTVFHLRHCSNTVRLASLSLFLPDFHRWIVCSFQHFICDCFPRDFETVRRAHFLRWIAVMAGPHFLRFLFHCSA